MKLIIEIDFEQAMKDCIDPPQNEWSLSDFEDDFKEQLNQHIDRLEFETGATISVKDENNNPIF